MMRFQSANASMHQHRISHISLFIQQRITPENSNFTLVVTPQLVIAKDDCKENCPQNRMLANLCNDLRNLVRRDIHAWLCDLHIKALMKDKVTIR